MSFIDNVTIEYENVKIPLLSNHTSDVYITDKVVLLKPKWIDDTHVSSCDKCNSRFTQFKRRHHCRQCGKIYCNDCCKDKLFLPHLDYGSPERVCEDCKPIVNIFYLAFSVEISLQLEGAKAFKAMCGTIGGIKELLRIGGVHILLHLGKVRDENIRMEVTAAVSLLIGYPTLHIFLVQLGTMKILCRILTETGSPEIQLDALGILGVFCENYDFKDKAFHHGALPPLLHLCSSHHDRVALLAVTCLSSITEHPSTHDELVQSNVGNVMACLLSLVHNTYDMVQEMVIKILANISFGSDFNREKIMQEDVYNGGCLCRVVNTRPIRYNAVCYATCIMANVSATCNVQGGQRDYLTAFCCLMSELEANNNEQIDLCRHVSRGIANCLRIPSNCDIVVNSISQIIEVCLKSTDHSTRFHGFRTAVSMLKFLPDQTIQVLHRAGTLEFLTCLCATQDTLDTILNATLSHVQTIAKPNNNAGNT